MENFKNIILLKMIGTADKRYKIVWYCCCLNKFIYNTGTYVSYNAYKDLSSSKTTICIPD